MGIFEVMYSMKRIIFIGFVLFGLQSFAQGQPKKVVAEVLRNNASTQDIPIIFVTAIVKRSEMGASEYQIGRNYFMFKPIRFDELIREIGTKIR